MLSINEINELQAENERLKKLIEGIKDILKNSCSQCDIEICESNDSCSECGRESDADTIDKVLDKIQEWER